MTQTKAHNQRDTWGLSWWVHCAIAGILTLCVGALDATWPSFSIFYLLPALYVAMTLRGRMQWIHYTVIVMAVFVAPSLDAPSRLGIQGTLNRALGISMGICVAYAIQARRHAARLLELTNLQLEDRVRLRSAELQATVGQLRESEERFRALVECGYEGINILDHRGQATYSSPGNAALVGLAPGEVDDDALGFVHPDDRPAVQAVFAQLVAEPNKIVDLQMRLMRKDGSYFWAEAHARNLFGHPAVRGIVVNWRDITERRLVEIELRRSEERYQLLTDLASSFSFQASVSSDNHLTFDWVGGKFEEMTGYRSADLIGLQWLELIHPDDLQFVLKSIADWRIPDTGPPSPIEIRMLDHSKAIRWIRLVVHALPRANSQAAQTVYGAVLDITERKRSEESLEMMRFSVEHAGDSVFWVGRKGQILYANQAASASRGYSKDEILTKTIFELDPGVRPDLWDRHFEALRQQGSITLETVHQTKDGRRFPIEVNANYVQIGDQEFNFAFARDISERKANESSLRESEERFRLLFDGANDAIFWADAETGILTHCNQAAVGLLGWERNEILGKSQTCLHPPEKSKEYRDLFQKHATSQSTKPIEVQVVNRYGKRIDVSISPSVTMIGEQKVLQGIFRDVTERKKLEQSLLLTQFSIDHAADSIFWIAPNGEILYVNEAACHVLGFSRDELVGKTVADIDPNFPASAWPAHWAEVKRRKTFTFESSQQTKQGKTLLTEVTVNYLEFEGQELNCAMVRDVSERRQLEAQVLHSQKLESLGVLAGGLAHDFNNLLAIVLGYSHMAQAQLPRDSSAVPMLREIEIATQRASDLTRQMLAYTGKGKTTVEPLRLDLITSELVELLKSVVSKKATLQLDLHPASILGDATQVRQVVMNLITNGSDALEGREGLIQIRTGERTMDEEQLRSPYLPGSLPAGRYAFIEVQDNGCGMDGPTCEKIFDPFFSTKFTGRGLGLAAVLGIVRSHHGVIKVHSQLGKGTLFEIYIPHSAVASHLTNFEVTAAPVTTGDATILIVEDDPKLALLASEILESAGYRILLAEDGLKGLELVQGDPLAIDAILLDLTMPRMDGREFLRRIHGLSTQIPIVVMSGYSSPEISAHSEEWGAHLFLQKPFEPRELLNKISDCLASP